MKAFLDTSSLIKLYHQEEGSNFVMDRVNNFFNRYSEISKGLLRKRPSQ